MRIALLALVAACGSRTAPPPPHNSSSNGTRVPADLGALVIVTSAIDNDSIPGFVPSDAKFPLVDPAHRMPPNTPARVTDAVGGAGAFTSAEPTKIPYGCDGNQLAVTPLVGTAKLAPGVAWAVFDTAARPKALARTVKSTTTEGTFAFDELRVLVQRDAQKPDRGLMRFIVGDAEVRADGFARTLMDGADPAMAAIDIAEGGPAVPRPLAAWSIDGSGHAPFLVAIERPGWEGTTLEAWLVERATAKQIEAMSVYLYRCAF